ncbi:uncharacterized protein [Coffea arabica]|uniref:Uncharacterized protein isoform X1 n=1 Tax=Coffea arabica TaxID=13443 RepID=A0A6P6XFX8_COFAR
MAISRKDVQVCMLKVLYFSIRFVWNCVKTHPYVSSTLIFLGLLYACNPSLFWLVIYLSAFVCIVFSTAKLYYRFGNGKNPKRDEKNVSDGAKPVRTSRLVKNDVHARSVRRRRSRETSRDDYSQTSEEEKSTVFSSTFNHGTVDKSAIVEQQPKEIREVEVDSLAVHAECSSSNYLRDLRPEFRIQSHEGPQRLDRERGEIETESSEGTEGEDDERDKEENNKAVQWNEDDQKNLMDVGISEIERNRRLESLIARRRARKLLSLQVRKTLMNIDNSAPFGHITPLMVPRHNPSILNPPSGRFSPMPGSAPSILVPMHNPFDIPYDPQEEKPILTGGSFDQEFLPLHQKDLFSRHESSSIESSFPGESKQDRKDASQFYDSAFKERERGSEQHENSELESQLDQKDTEKIIEVETSQPPKSNSNMVRDHSYAQEHIQSPEQGEELVDGRQEEENSEEKTIWMPSDDLSGKSSTASSSEEEEQFPRVDKDAILKSLSSPVSRNISAKWDSRSEMEHDLINSGPSMLHDNRMEGHFFADKACSHTPTYSISSDLQVEVSEISSPPLTVDGSISSHDENRISEGSMEGEITSSSEDISAASPHQCGGGDEKESILKDIHEVSEIGTVEVSNTRSSEEPVASAGKMTEKAPKPLTQLTSNAELPDASQDHPSGFNFSSEENYRKPITCDSRNGVAEKPENIEKEVKRICGHDDSNLPENSKAENFSVGDKDSGTDGWIQEGGMAHAEWSLTSSPTYIGYTGDQAEMMEEHDEIFAYYEAIGEDDNVRTSEDSGEESIDISQYGNLDMAMAVEEHDVQESNQDNEGGQQTAERGFPRVTERYNGRQVSRLLPHLLVRQVPSIIPLSPRSVLQPKFSIDPSSSSHYTDEMHEEFGTPMAETSNILNDARGESLPLSAPVTTSLAVEDTTSCISHGRDAVLQESSNLSTTSALEANNGLGNECLVHEYDRGQTDLQNFSTTSTEQANYSGFRSQCGDHESEKGYYELGNFRESSRERSSSCPESTSSELKPMGESSSRMLKEKDEGSEELYDNEAPIAFAKKIAQAQELSMPQISPQEPAKPLGGSSEVTYNPRKNETLVQEMEEKSKDFLRNLMQAFKD